MKPQKLIDHVYALLGTFWKPKRPRKREEAREGSGVVVSNFPSEKKKAEIEKLCKKLFERKELIASGRLQLLGLEKIKLRMGKGWPGLQIIVYDICEKIMKKYFGPGDIFIRYQDSGYILLFAEASLTEAELKIALISEEIRRELFFEDNLKEIEIQNQVTHIRSRLVKNIDGGAHPFPESIDFAFEESMRQAPPEEPDSGGPLDLSSVRRIEINPSRNGGARSFSPLDLGFSVKKIQPDTVKYLPLWDNQKEKLAAHLCLSVPPGAQGDLLRAHKKMFQGKSASEKGNMDIAMLDYVVQFIWDHQADLPEGGIICPLYFDTLSRVEDSEKCRMICQKMNSYVSQNLLFYVFEMPFKTSWINLNQIVAPFKTYGRRMFAEISLDADIDFDVMRLSDIDDIAFIAETDPANRKRRSLQAAADLRNFTFKAKKNRLNPEIFAVGVDDPIMALSLADAGVRYMAGDAIHPPVTQPVERINLESNNNFKIWQKSLNMSRSG